VTVYLEYMGRINGCYGNWCHECMEVCTYRETFLV